MRILIFACLFFTSINLFAQDNKHYLFGKDAWLSKAEATGFTFGAGYSNGEIMKKNLNGFNLEFLCEFNHRVLSGFQLDYLIQRNPSFNFTTPAQVVNPIFSVTGFNWRNEIYLNQNFIHFSIPIDIGLVYASYNDKYYQNSQGMSQVIRDATFFGGSLGTNLGISLSPFFDLSLGAKYRYTAGAERLGTDIDYTGMVYSINVRCNLNDKNTK